jgi:hypothetical protein
VAGGVVTDDASTAQYNISNAINYQKGKGKFMSNLSAFAAFP